MSVAVHPGVIATELGRNSAVEAVQGIQGMVESEMLTLKTLGVEAAISLVAALDPKLREGETEDG